MLKAEDTVMLDTKMIDLGREVSRAEADHAIANHQAEISFKAGIEEVTGKLGVYENEMGFCEISNHIPYSRLKEWGIK